MYKRASFFSTETRKASAGIIQANHRRCFCCLAITFFIVSDDSNIEFYQHQAKQLLRQVLQNTTHDMILSRTLTLAIFVTSGFIQLARENYLDIKQTDMLSANQNAEIIARTLLPQKELSLGSTLSLFTSIESSEESFWLAVIVCRDSEADCRRLTALSMCL